ncbi:Rv3235 family protein [Paenarthrobacter sp. NPDC090522]|uniref:Rv3235 family protein n=1 Tax=Paenarthrobacter sp. NPDC090522 TaxID=3364383 RepID=UPI00380E1FC9
MTATTARRPTDVPTPTRTPATQGAGAANVDVRLVARSIAQAAVEVLAGTRPVQQLARFLDADCYLALQHRAGLTRDFVVRSRAQQRVHLSPMVRSVRVCHISDEIHEATIVVAEDLRCRAIAMRLELSAGTWQVTALEIG